MTGGEEEIQENQQRNAADGTTEALFIGLEGHRADHGNNQIDTSNLPTADELQSLGINKIVYLTESAVGQNTGDIPPDMQPYVEKLRAAGLELDVRGVDPRQNSHERGNEHPSHPFDSLEIPSEIRGSYQVEEAEFISAQAVEDVRAPQIGISIS